MASRSPSVGAKTPSRVAGRSFLVGSALLTTLTVGNVPFGVLYEAVHFGDTLLLLGAGRRMYEGLTPVLAFGHFYGGVMAEGIAMTMRLFGPDVFAIERFALLVLACLAPLAVFVRIESAMLTIREYGMALQPT